MHGQFRALLPKRFSYDSQFEVVVRTGASRTKLINTFLNELFGVYGRAEEASGRKRYRTKIGKFYILRSSRRPQYRANRKSFR